MLCNSGPGEKKKTLKDYNSKLLKRVSTETGPLYCLKALIALRTLSKGKTKNKRTPLAYTVIL